MPPPSATAPAAAPAAAAVAAPRRKQFGLSEETSRIEKMVEAAAGLAPPRLVPWLKKAAPAIAVVAAFINRVAPVLIKAYATLFEFFQLLPQDLMMVVFGVALCFFGGVYPAAIAAAEAFRMYGWDNTRQHLMMLWEEHQRLRGENHRDNSIDEDGNGIADVDEVNGRELFTRKMKLFLVHADPARMNAAVGGLWHATLGVIGVLKIQFARTVTLGAAIGDVTSKTMGRAATPVLAHLLPAEYRKWIPVLVNWVCKTFGMLVAWTVQRILSAAHSAMRGGFMASRHLFKFLAERNGKKFNAEDTYLDEVVGFALAGLGFYTQLKLGFGLPFLVSFILFPVSCLEYVIEYLVSSY